MTPDAYTLLARVHGHLAMLGLALILHPVFTLGRPSKPSRYTHLTAELGAALIATVFTIGWLQYPSYRRHLKPELWASGHDALYWFESKEHLAAITVALAVSAALTLRLGRDDPAARRTARALFVSAACTGLITAILGVAVTTTVHPAW